MTPPAGHTTDMPPFLDQTPPPWVIRAAAWVLLATCLLATVLAFALELPLTVEGRFTLVPMEGADPVRAVRSGTISALFVQPGQEVSKGDPLLGLRSEAVGELEAAIQTLVLKQQGLAMQRDHARARLERRKGDHQATLESLERIQANHQRQLAIARRQLKLLRSNHTRQQTLFREGLISQEQLELHALAVSEAALNRSQHQEQLERGLESLREEVQAMEDEQAQHLELEAQLTEAMETVDVQLEAKRAAQLMGEGGVLTLEAPCDGVVAQRMVRGSGAVVQRGEVLMVVDCEPKTLHVEVLFPGTSAGLLKPGQAVKLLFEAFPYQRYGMLYGRLTWAGPNAQSDAPQTAFRAVVALKDSTFVVRGAEYPLRAGMGGIARVVVGKQRPVSYIFEPMRRLREDLETEGG